MKTRITTILIIAMLLLAACLPVEEMVADPISDNDEVTSDPQRDSSSYKGGYAIGSDLTYTMEAPIVYEGQELNLPYQIGVNGESTMRLMLFVDGVPQQFEVDTKGSDFEQSDSSTAWLAEVLDTAQEVQHVGLKFEPNLGQAGQTVCLLPVALVNAGYPAELNPNGLGEQELVVVAPQPLMFESEVAKENKPDAHPIEFVETEEAQLQAATGARVFVYDGVTLAAPTLEVVDGQLNVHLRLNNVEQAYRVSIFLNGEPLLIDGQLAVLVEPSDEAVLLEYNFDLSDAPLESQIFAVAIPVGQPCMLAKGQAHVSLIKAVQND